jgi:glycerol-3-phosphate acyltransferase PlsY
VDYLLIFIGLLIAYLLGSVPTSVWVGKWFYNKDVRDEGSGNAGATNTVRVLGVKAGIPVIIIDIFKGFLAVWLMRFFLPQAWDEDTKIYFEIIAGLIAVVGHTLPVFAGFRGGKGVATLFGAGLALYGWAVVVPLVIFVVIVALTRYVSLGSLIGGVSFPFVVVFAFKIYHPGLVGLAIFAGLFIVWTHRKNIGRLIRGEENKLSFKRNGS